jgi:hypothetical protein
VPELLPIICCARAVLLDDLWTGWELLHYQLPQDIRPLPDLLGSASEEISQLWGLVRTEMFSDMLHQHDALVQSAQRVPEGIIEGFA